MFSLSQLERGTYFFDDADAKLYTASSPAHHRVEVAETERAFESFGLGISKVSLRGLTVEKFATPSGGAVQARGDWTIQDCEIRLNHATGLEGGGLVVGNYLHDNGQLGYYAYGLKALTFTGNEVARNNYAAYAPGWEAGGVKIAMSSNVLVSDNFVHDNAGAGLWTDWDNSSVVYRSNTVDDNGGPGIFHEASGSALILDNLVRRNGFDPAFSGWLDGSGIVTNSSRDVEIAHNRLEDNLHGIGATQTERGVGPFGRRVISGLYIHDNTVVTHRSGIVGGVVSAFPDPGLFKDRARFVNNRYRMCSSSTFAWSGEKTSADWVGAGQDVTGVFDRIC